MQLTGARNYSKIVKKCWCSFRIMNVKVFYFRTSDWLTLGHNIIMWLENQAQIIPPRDIIITNFLPRYLNSRIIQVFILLFGIAIAMASFKFQFAFLSPSALFDLGIVLWTCEYFRFTGCRLTDLSEIFNWEVDGQRKPSVFGVFILEDCVFCGKLKFFGSTKAPELTER